VSTAAIPLGGTDRRRTLRRVGWGLGGAPLLLLLFVVLVTATTTSVCNPQGSASTAPVSAPSKEALADIPGNYLPLYVAAGQKYGLDWSILAGIGSIETNHGRLKAPGVTSGANAFGCCGGPMQFFFKPYGGRLRANETNRSTWGMMAVDGNGDGFKDVWDPADAIPSAARYLKASGAPREWQRAIFAYNRAQWYVDDVLGHAKRYRSAASDAGGITSIPIGANAATATSAGVTCPAAASTGTGSAGDITAAVTPWIDKDWGQALAAGMKSLGWPAGTAWCQIFVQNVLEQLGIERPTPNSAHSSDPYTWATTKGWGEVLHGPGKPASAGLQLQPGDIVMYGAPGAASQHVNMVEKVDQRGVIVVGGNQSCGGANCVSRRGPARLTGTGGSLQWSTGDTRTIWAIVRPPAPKGVSA
jgi:hypothetical protein